MGITNAEIITFLKPYSKYIGWGFLIGLIIILTYFLRFRTKKPQQQDSLIEAYNASKKRGRPRKQEKIAEIMEEEPSMDLEKELRNDIERWKKIKEKLDARRGEILHTNLELEEELARIDAYRKFIDDIFKKVGKDEN